MDLKGFQWIREISERLFEKLDKNGKIWWFCMISMWFLRKFFYSFVQSLGSFWILVDNFWWFLDVFA